MTLSLTLPTVGGDTDAWGDVLNTALTDIETEVNANETAITDQADASGITVDDSGLTIITHTNVQQALEDLENFSDFLYQEADRPADRGLCGASVRIPEGTSGSAQPTSGTRYYVRVKCGDDRTLSNVLIGVVTAGATLTSGQNLIGVLNAAGTLIGTCPDQTTPWTSTGVKTAALTVVGGQSLAVTAGQIIYVQFLAKGTTTPAFSRAGTGIGWGNAGVATAPFWFSSGATAQTALATSTTMTGLTADSNSWAVAVS